MEFSYKKTVMKSLQSYIDMHLKGLAFPIESYMEDILIASDVYELLLDGVVIGYTGITEDTIQVFYVVQDYFRYAPLAFQYVIESMNINNVLLLTQDTLLNTLLAEWNYEWEKDGCCFISGNSKVDLLIPEATFRKAELSDVDMIREIAGDFFEESSGGYLVFEDRITDGTIFILELRGDILGFGIIENSRLNNNVVSVGMFVNKVFRRKGAAREIISYLRKYAYDNDKTAVSGCWYYNTLSRKSLESAGMIMVFILGIAKLKGKDVLPLRTGNPPGELVE